jgi:hypothetical protein
MIAVPHSLVAAVQVPNRAASAATSTRCTAVSATKKYASACCSPLVCLSATCLNTPSPESSGRPPAAASSSAGSSVTPSTSDTLFAYSTLLSRAASPLRLLESGVPSGTPPVPATLPMFPAPAMLVVAPAPALGAPPEAGRIPNPPEPPPGMLLSPPFAPAPDAPPGIGVSSPVHAREATHVSANIGALNPTLIVVFGTISQVPRLTSSNRRTRSLNCQSGSLATQILSQHCRPRQACSKRTRTRECRSGRCIDPTPATRPGSTTRARRSPRLSGLVACLHPMHSITATPLTRPGLRACVHSR